MHFKGDMPITIPAYIKEFFDNLYKELHYKRIRKVLCALRFVGE